MTQGILQQVCGDEKHEDEHGEGKEEPACHEPIVSESNEEDGSDDCGSGGEDTQQDSPGLEMEEPFLTLNIAGVSPRLKYRIRWYGELFARTLGFPMTDFEKVRACAREMEMEI